MAATGVDARGPVGREHLGASARAARPRRRCGRARVACGRSASATTASTSGANVARLAVDRRSAGRRGGRRSPGASPGRASAVGATDELQRRLVRGPRRDRRRRRSCGRTRRSGRATRTRPCRGSGAACGCGVPTASVTGRPLRWSSSASCTPVAEAPTTSTPPAGRSSGLAIVARRRPGGCRPSRCRGQRRDRRPVAPSGGDHDVVGHGRSRRRCRRRSRRRRGATRWTVVCSTHRRVERRRRSRSKNATTSPAVMNPSGSGPS